MACPNEFTEFTMKRRYCEPYPTFRWWLENDVLDVTNGGTGSTVPVTSDKIMVSKNGAIVEGPALGDGQVLMARTGVGFLPVTLTGGVGADGATGPIGPQGDPGPVGPQGVQGDAGAIGPAGPIGPVGPQGPMGPIGLPGDMGVDGPQGPQGVQGIQGDPGLQGVQGLQGDVGPQGPQGVQGDMGPEGVQGPMGLQGDVGPTGATGPQGLVGAQGPMGLQGDVGPTGATGLQGPQGPQGLVGATGPQGNPTTLVAGAATVITGGPSSYTISSSIEVLNLISGATMPTGINQFRTASFTITRPSALLYHFSATGFLSSGGGVHQLKIGVGSLGGYGSSKLYFNNINDHKAFPMACGRTQYGTAGTYTFYLGFDDGVNTDSGDFAWLSLIILPV